MNSKAFVFFKNLSYTLSSNLVSMIISTIVILVLPKLIGVEEYGYWQLYIFYSSYVGFLHFGWNDGIYLRYGGEKYKDLDKKTFFSQFWMLATFQLVFGTLIFLYGVFNQHTKNGFIFEATAICMLFVNLRYFLLYTLQCTNRIKEYAAITLFEKVLYCVLIILMLVSGFRNFEFMIWADLIGKLASLIYAAYFCKDIVFRHYKDFQINFRETFTNIDVGIKLMFSNIASMLILGIIRFGIQHTWGVKIFGKVSLSLSISNLTMTFITAVGVIMFPLLRRTEQSRLPNLFKTFRAVLTFVLLGCLILYYPLNVILLAWLPKYSESLKYLAIIFSLCVYAGRMELLVNTFLKTLRKERLILLINVISLLASLLITSIVALGLRNLILTVTSIVVLIAFRYTLAEILLSKLLHVTIKKEIFYETSLITLFIITGWFFSSITGFIIYSFFYLAYLILKNKELKLTLLQVRTLTEK
ncbi:hypothetical protein BpJC4_24250 [Weizmannia acidilactici]|uniref:hypothetical protein n=1 Tax=Weizmannia acidilactici TaxID=2607726 RepID=UPI00124ED4CD|nr:hypothetical protein [Weizmannia acidilactici]GER67954.1 hypothetical protein BpJC4_24250 [Weizmannia acidilactici]